MEMYEDNKEGLTIDNIRPLNFTAIERGLSLSKVWSSSPSSVKSMTVWFSVMIMGYHVIVPVT